MHEHGMHIGLIYYLYQHNTVRHNAVSLHTHTFVSILIRFVKRLIRLSHSRNGNNQVRWHYVLKHAYTEHSHKRSVRFVRCDGKKNVNRCRFWLNAVLKKHASFYFNYRCFHSNYLWCEFDLWDISGEGNNLIVLLMIAAYSFEDETYWIVPRSLFFL